MNISKDDLKKLQLHWYQLLEEAGFRHIEKFSGYNLVLKKTAFQEAYNNYHDEFLRNDKIEYYRVIGIIAQDPLTHYDNETEKFIMVRHAEGAQIKMIVLELKALRTPRDRATVRAVIKRYTLSWKKSL